MTRKRPEDADRRNWLKRLNLIGDSKPPATPNGAPIKYPTPPSRRNRKALTTWQDDAAVKQLKDIANEHGLSQQALIAEGINYVLAKYGKPPVAK